jgi:hypothetical protein
MTSTSKIRLTLLAAATVFIGNLAYASHLRAQLTLPDGAGCNAAYCSSAHPEVCGGQCVCSAGFPKPQCY